MFLYEVRVISIGFDQERVLLRSYGITEEDLLKILDLYGNAANKIDVWRIYNDTEDS